MNKNVKIFLLFLLKKAIPLLFLLIALDLPAQLSIFIEKIPANTPENSQLYLAGNINQWNPADKLYRFKKDSTNHYVLRLDSLTEKENLQFKVTLGTWDLVETDAYGADVANRSYTYEGPDSIYISIGAWNNPLIKSKLKSSAAYNVEVISDSFYMPQLNRYRRIWIYLPPDYDFEEENNYPVLYMQDGQNLFDRVSAPYGEWQVDESLNALFEEGKTIPIVVGIDHGGVDRLNEYSMEDLDDPAIDAEGDLYLDFIITTLKPYVDSHYRTLADREFTGIMGSSVGGLITCYAILDYSEVFALAGIFSPSYWLADSIYTIELPEDPIRIYQICGSEEEGATVQNCERMYKHFIEQSEVDEDFYFEVVKGGKHNEKFWAQQFQAAILFLYNP
jgi:alpha-glucosidase